MKLSLHLAPHKIKYEIIPIRNIVFNFNTYGFEELENYNQSNKYCFDGLGLESTGSNNAKECNVIGKILLSRYDLFVSNNQLVAERSRSITHITLNLTAKEPEKRYGNRVRSRLREMFNLIGFDENSKYLSKTAFY